MKKFIVISIISSLLISNSTLVAQLINANPDPNGDPWYTGGTILPTSEQLQLVPTITAPPISNSTQLAYAVDNSNEIFFPPIFRQEGESCVHAAEIGYIFTYEINRIRNIASGRLDSAEANSYHYLYTYNFKNEGSGNTRTTKGSGFNIAMDHGVPESNIYYDSCFNDTTSDKFKYWMTGSENYLSALNNGLVENDDLGYSKIEIGETISSLDDLKHWINDHYEGGDTTIGGVAEIVAYSGDEYNPWTISTIEVQPYATMSIITEWETFGSHSMTVVGYNDSIYYDLDGDSIQDSDEYGAFKVANSWGNVWENNGFIWVPYKLMLNGEGLASNGYAYVCEVKDYAPDIVIKTEIEHNRRDKIRIWAGKGDKANDSEPDERIRYEAFNAQGGPYDMRGIYDGSIDIALDYGIKYSEEIGKVFLCIFEKHDLNNEYEGVVNGFSLVDNRWGEEFELEFEIDENNPDSINDGGLLGAWTYLGIEYDLLSTPDDPWPIPSQTVSTNKVCRFESLLASNSTLTIEPPLNNVSVKLDFYNGTLTIPTSSTLDIGDDVIITAKRDTCKIVINGDLSIGENVSFIAEDRCRIPVN